MESMTKDPRLISVGKENFLTVLNIFLSIVLVTHF